MQQVLQGVPFQARAAGSTIKENVVLYRCSSNNRLKTMNVMSSNLISGKVNLGTLECVGQYLLLPNDQRRERAWEERFIPGPPAHSMNI